MSKGGGIIHTVCLAALFVSMQAASPAYCAETARVLSVVDADILEVSYKGKVEYVRLAGIDIQAAPSGKEGKSANEEIRDALAGKLNLEVVISPDEKNKPVAVSTRNRLAKLFMKRTVKPGAEVILEIDGRREDDHKMLLCYVFLPKGRFLNEELVRAGFATVSDEPFIRYREKLTRAYKAARKGNKL